MLKYLPLLFLIGCAANKEISTPAIAVNVKNTEFTEPSIYIAQMDFIEPILKSEDVKIEEAPINGWFTCGGYIPLSEQEEIRLLLKNATSIMRLTTTYETWTPIDGEAKKHYIFSIK